MSGGSGGKPMHVPDAPHRPGDEAGFTEWPWSPGDLGRPGTDCQASETLDLAEGLVRVLGDDNKFSGEWDPKLTSEEMLMGLEHMMRLRIFDDRMMKMQRTGKLSFYMRSLGEEAVSIAQPWHWRSRIGSSRHIGNRVHSLSEEGTW